MSGSLRDTFGGERIITDYLGPHRLPCVRCGPLCLTTASADEITVVNLTVTGTTNINIPIYIPGPDHHIWIPIGPIIIIGPGTNTVVEFPMGVGVWLVEISLAGTGTTLADFAQYTIQATVVCDGTLVTVPAGGISVSREVYGGVMTDANTEVTISGFTDIHGFGNMRASVTTPVNSKWTGFFKCVGSATATP